MQKYIRDAGISSRRKAEELIKKGKVKVDGVVVATLGSKIDEQSAEVRIEGKLIKPVGDKLYLVLHKPSGYATTRQDIHAEKTVYDLLPKKYGKILHSVGRLDRETEGLLIFTNDGELTNILTHPRFAHEKEYRIETEKPFKEQHRQLLERGVYIDKRKYLAKKISYHRIGNCYRVCLVINEGKKRQVRRMFASIGFANIYLKRVREGKLELGDLPVGKYRFIHKAEIV